MFFDLFDIVLCTYVFYLGLSFVLLLVPCDRPQAIPVDVGTTIKATTVTDSITDVVFAPTIATVLTDYNTEVNVF